jgi:hypothetical protein
VTTKDQRFTVIGIYTDTMRRFSEVVKAETPVEAEQRIRPDIMVAGVLEGEHVCVDYYANEDGWALLRPYLMYDGKVVGRSSDEFQGPLG